MHKIYFLLLIIIFSCKNSQENACFDNGQKTKYNYAEFKVNSLNEILKANPSYVKLYSKNNRLSYKQEQLKNFEYKEYDETIYKQKRLDYENKFAIFFNTFGEQFIFKQTQTEKDKTYGIAENQFGTWLLEVSKNNSQAYFLGLSDYTFISEKQNDQFVINNKLILNGSFIRVKEVWGLPYSPQMEAVKDFLTFEINLVDIKKDFDQDGFNDIFEKAIGLNPNNFDTDLDGISDFIDVNPLFKSEKSKFTDLYQQILDLQYRENNYSELNYSFASYISDCEFFQSINPEKSKVLIYPESERLNKRNDYHRNIFSSSYGKIKKNEKDQNVFFINESNNGGSGFWKAEYIDGKWKIKYTQTILI